MNLTYGQKRALAIRRLRRAFAIEIYPPFDHREPEELDAEFQKGLEAGIQVAEWNRELSWMRIRDHHEHTKRNESLLRNWLNDTCLACLLPWSGPSDGGES